MQTNDKPKSIAFSQPHSSMFLCNIIDNGTSEIVELCSKTYGNKTPAILYNANQIRKVIDWLTQAADYLDEDNKTKPQLVRGSAALLR